MEELMLKIENITKQYKLGQIGGTTFREELQRQYAKLRGKEDPTRQIGSRAYQTGEHIMALDGVSFDVSKGAFPFSPIESSEIIFSISSSFTAPAKIPISLWLLS